MRIKCLPGRGATNSPPPGPSEDIKPPPSKAKTAPDSYKSDKSITGQILRRHIMYFILGGVAKAVWGGLVLYAAFELVKELLDSPNKKLAGVFFACCVIFSEALRQMNLMTGYYAVLIRKDILRELYKRAMWSTSDKPSEVLALLLNDCQMVFDAATLFHYLWSGPIEALAICGLVTSVIKVCAVPGIALMLIVLGIQFLAGYQISKKSDIREGMAAKRLALLKEFAFYSKQIKLYAWERIYGENIGALRKDEEKIIFSASVYKIVSLVAVFGLPSAMAIVIFSYYALTVAPLKATVTFVTLSLFNTLRLPLSMLPKAMKTCVEGYKALKRIEHFLQANPLPPAALSESTAKEDEESKGIYLTAASNGFLKDISFSVPKGTCIGIQGKVDSGKSYLLSSIIHDVFAQGSCTVTGTLAYVPQVTWLQNRSVRDNITFGLPYDEAWYKTVIESCALTDDFLTMAQGDLTSVGDKGMAVSGGQKQRISIARAVYRNADCYLLDNPLGALDHRTAHYVLTKCIRGLLKDKAVLLTSYNAQHLRMCDRLLGLDNGHLCEPHSEDVAPPDQAHVDASILTLADAPAPLAPARPGRSVEHVTVPISRRMSREGAQGHGHGHGGSRRVSFHSNETRAEAAAADMVEEAAAEDLSGAKGKAKGPPKRPNGVIWWMQRGGYWLAAGVVVVHAIAQTLRVLNDNWLRYWTRDYFDGWGQNRYAWTTGCWVIGFQISLIIRGFCFYLYSMRAGRKIHSRLVGTALYLPFQYFMRPAGIGNILSCYARCVTWADDLFADTAHLALVYFFILVTTISIAGGVIYWVGVFGAGLFISLPVALAIFIPASRSNKMAADRLKASLASQVTESVHGVTVIRAFAATVAFVDDITKTSIDLATIEKSMIRKIYVLSFVLDNIGCLLMGAIAFMVVDDSIVKKYVRSDRGLVISNALQAMMFFAWVVRSIADSLFYATALGDIPEAHSAGESEIPSSPEDYNAHNTAPVWKGAITFSDVWLRYEPESPLVLRGISFSIIPGERVGIIGRSGCGKSSLMASLFLLNSPEKGQILLDGVDITSIGLHQLRSSLCIIPQDPVLFTGTWRTNLDPFGLYNDSQIWGALDMVRLRSHIQDLDAEVDENALSMGQKQLLSLCRVLVKRPRILVLDEASSNMDHDSEQVLVDVMKSPIMDGVTVLNIAHRIEILRGYDRVIRMATGQIELIATPEELLGQ